MRITFLARGASPAGLGVPPYTDGLTKHVYEGLCKALALHRSSTTPQRAIELELRFGSVALRQSASCVMVPALTPVVLGAAPQQTHTFRTTLKPDVARGMESHIKVLGEIYAKRSRRVAAPASSIDHNGPSAPSTQIVVSCDAVRFVYEAVPAQTTDPPHASRHVYMLRASEQKRALDAMDIACTQWLADMRLAIASEEAQTPCPSSLPPTVTTDSMMYRLRTSVPVHRYLHFHVVYQAPLRQVQHGRTSTYTCGSQLTPTPWHAFAGFAGKTRIELEFNLRKIDEDWVRAVGSKAVRAALQQHRGAQAEEAAHISAKADAHVRGEPALRSLEPPMEPFLRTVVEDTLAIAQFVTRQG